MPADDVTRPRYVYPDAVTAWAERTTAASFALEAGAADVRYRYRLNPEALVPVFIPVHVFEHYGEAEVQASATRLRCIVHVSEDGVTPIRTFYPEGYERL